jgi:hypothetical protein
MLELNPTVIRFKPMKGRMIRGCPRLWLPYGFLKDLKDRGREYAGDPVFSMPGRNEQGSSQAQK